MGAAAAAGARRWCSRQSCALAALQLWDWDWADAAAAAAPLSACHALQSLALPMRGRMSCEWRNFQSRALGLCMLRCLAARAVAVSTSRLVFHSFSAARSHARSRPAGLLGPRVGQGRRVRGAAAQRERMGGQPHQVVLRRVAHAAREVRRQRKSLSRALAAPRRRPVPGCHGSLRRRLLGAGGRGGALADVARARHPCHAHGHPSIHPCRRRLSRRASTRWPPTRRLPRRSSASCKSSGTSRPP